MKDALSWRKTGLREERGIIVGCTESMEWLLGWWWLHYHYYNSFPVTFVDFGMSESAKTWCRKRGELVGLPITDFPIATKEEIDPKIAAVWEEFYTETVWQARKGWFKKPLAFLQTPYKETIWIDLDCQIRGSIEPIFQYCQGPAKVGLAEELKGVQDVHRGKKLLQEKETLYNSGVIAFQRGAPLIHQWVEKAVFENANYIGDQDMLSRLIFEKPYAVQVLPDLYNWRPLFIDDPAIVIFHYITSHAKEAIKQQLRCYREAFLIDL